LSEEYLKKLIVISDKITNVIEYSKTNFIYFKKYLNLQYKVFNLDLNTFKNIRNNIQNIELFDDAIKFIFKLNKLNEIKMNNYESYFTYIYWIYHLTSNNIIITSQYYLIIFIITNIIHNEHPKNGKKFILHR